MALAAMVALEDDDAVTLPEAGTGMNGVDDADTFVPQVPGIVVELEIVLGPDSATFQANRRYLGADDRVTGQIIGIRPFHELEAPGFRYRQDNVALCHARDLPIATIQSSDYRERYSGG